MPGPGPSFVTSSWRETACLVFLLVALAPGRTLAHERPRGQRVVVDAQRIVVVTNRGLVASADGGAHFDLYCGTAAGLVSTDRPPVQLLPDGRVLLAGYRGVQLSSVDYCDFEPTPLTDGAPALATYPGDPLGALVGTNIAVDPQGLYRTRDGGGSFELVHSLPEGAFFLEGLAYAPADPLRVYAAVIGAVGGGDDGEDAGVAAGVGVGASIAASRDGGETFVHHPLPVAADQALHRVLAVDPVDPDTVFVSLAGRVEEGRLDTLLRSRDGGETFQALLSLPELGALVIRPDGGRLWVGAEDGLHVSDDGGDSFLLQHPEPVTCLTHRGGRLWVCLDWPGVGAVAGLAYSDDGGAGLTRVMSFDDVAAPPACPAGSDVASRCDMAWEDWARELLPPPTPPQDAGAPDAGGQMAGDAGMPSADAATADSGVDAGTGGPASSGCGCRLGPRSRAPVAPLLLGLLLLGARHRRRARVKPNAY